LNVKIVLKGKLINNLYMKKLTLDEVIKLSPVIVHQGRYVYLKGQEKNFLISQDDDETTIITEEKILLILNMRKM
jgi:topoisomerase IA-like protein